MKLIKNEFYIMSRPRHIYCTIIYFSEKFSFPFSKTVSDNIDHLRELTDIVFIFSKDSQKEIFPKKLSSLYGATSYCIGRDNSEPDSVVYSLEYLVNIVKKYSSYYFISGKNLEFLKKEDFDNILQMNQSQVIKSVFSYIRLPFSDIAKIYLRPRQTILQKLLSIKWDEFSGMYCTHTTTDKILFLRPSTIVRIQEFLDNDYLDYLLSFDEFSFESFLSSVINFIDSSMVLNLNIKDAKS